MSHSDKSIDKPYNKIALLFYFASFIASWTILMIKMSKRIWENNLIYAIGEIQAYDNNLFSNNIFLGEGVISPRYLVDAIFRLIMSLNGGDWASADLIWVYLAVAVQAVAISNIAYRISKKNQLVVSAVFSCFILYINNYLAGFTLYEYESTSIGMGIAFSMLGISFLIGENRNYNMAWLFCALALICHVHEGLYGCVIVFICVVADAIHNKRNIILRQNGFFLFAVLAAILVVVPSMITDSMDISSREFVNIYSLYRHPHHLVPSSWNTESIYTTLLTDASFFAIPICIECIDKKQNIHRILEAFMLIGSWVFAILFMYVFTEIKPIAAVSTLFISKFFKYILLMGLIWMLKSSFDLRDKGKYITHYMMIFFVLTVSACSAFQMCFYIATVVIIYMIEKRNDNSKIIIYISNHKHVFDFAFACTMMYVKRKSLGLSYYTFHNLISDFKTTIITALRNSFCQGLVILVVFFAIMIMNLFIRKKLFGYHLISILSLVCLLIFSMVGKIIVYEDGVRFLNGETALKYSMGSELYDFAFNFRKMTDVADVFLADPDDTINTGWFQVVSERNCYVVEKVIPSSKVTIDDWYYRYTQTNSFYGRSSDEIKNVMNLEGIDYLLLTVDNYDRFNEDNDFVIFMKSESDLYRIYKLI